MKLGIFAKTFPGSAPYPVLAACRAAQFDAVQYNMACSGLGSLPVSISDEIADHISRASDAAGVEVAVISATYNMIDPDEARKSAGRRAFAAIAAAAARIGTDFVTVCSGSKDSQDKWRHHPANEDPISWVEMCREFEVLLDIADQYDLNIGVEPEHANVVCSPRKAARLLNEFAGSRLRIILDPANILEGVPQDQHHPVIDEALGLLGPKIALAHAKDRHSDGGVAPAGRGTVDWGYFLKGLASVGFNGPLIAHGISATDAPLVASFLSQELNRL